MKDEIKEILRDLEFASGVFDYTITPDRCTFLKDYITNLQEENENLLYYKKIIDKIIIVKDYPSKEDSNYILCNMSKQELYKLLCETRERIYKEVGKDYE